ncbi:uncharacterized protein LOC113078238 [Carassius auratus]|uniref:Uncharacterized protein LOC113078238 n=1 Tax=Carassius auratus TaxID=7957 RepID=A0A6P6NBD0_CARAU|nr:uncharacterized protein LOC113078238 [Carassius auratus]
MEEQSNQVNKDWSDLDESEGSVFVPSVEESTDDEDLDSEESQLEQTIRKTAQSKLARHLERSHSNETEVAKAFSFPKRSKERRILLEQLRNQGNYYHNIKVLETGRGEIITWRQPTEDADISEFLPCPDCLAFFMKKDLWKHSKTCRGQRDVKRSRGERIGYSLKKACQLSLGQSLMAGDRDTEKKLKNFIKLIDSHWQASQECGAGLKQLKENVNGAEWKILAETLLCQIILFNRRREGEASKLLLASYVNRNVKPPNEDVVKSLTKLERELCNELTRLEIRGKRGKKVPVLLTKDMLESMDLLNESRSTVGIDEANPYVFARLGALTHIRGSDCLRKFSKTCGAKDPRSLTSTKLRKQIATLSQIMNLKNNELDQLAKFLGHDIRVHREYYRLSENTIQLAKVSKLLLSLEKGSDCYKGKSLEEITFSTEETENDRSPASRGLREHECRTTEADASEKDDEPSTSVKTVERKRRVTETDGLQKEDEEPSTSVKTVKRKRRVTETGKQSVYRLDM